MTEDNDRQTRDHALVREAQTKGILGKALIYTRLSGPGWLQSAITLGGGSLAGSLYLGVLGGPSLLWLQPMAMIMGIIMLSAIGYVVLSTGERPFGAINKHVNPVLGWGWAIASLMANMVWALPQFGLATGAVQQNLLPAVLGAESGMSDTAAKLIIVGAILALTVTVTWLYDGGGWGVKAYELVLKSMVGLIVICFFGVVLKMSLTGDGIEWGGVLRGFIPDFSLLNSPAETLRPHLDAVAPAFRDFWTSRILGDQRDVMITAVATSVGINMTFLLGYSMLSKGWNRDYRGLAIFDLSTGMLIPFMLATSCVVIAAGQRFHGTPEAGFLGETDARGELILPAKNIISGVEGLMDARISFETGAEAFAAIKENPEALAAARAALPEADRRMAAMLVKRDAANLAASLQPLTGDFFANLIFGLGVVGMGVSTITILMLISGFVICEMLGLPPRGWPHRLGCLAASVGALGPFFWSKAAVYLAVPTSVFGMCLLPIAYFSFFLLMNQKSLLGDDMPRGMTRVVWNVLMGAASGFAAFGALWSIWSKTQWVGIGGLALFIGAAVAAHFMRGSKNASSSGA